MTERSPMLRKSTMAASSGEVHRNIRVTEVSRDSKRLKLYIQFDLNAVKKLEESLSKSPPIETEIDGESLQDGDVLLKTFQSKPYRVKIVTKWQDAEPKALVQFVDYGFKKNVAVKELYKIRDNDIMTMDSLVTECFSAEIVFSPSDFRADRTVNACKKLLVMVDHVYCMVVDEANHCPQVLVSLKEVSLTDILVENGYGPFDDVVAAKMPHTVSYDETKFKLRGSNCFDQGYQVRFDNGPRSSKENVHLGWSSSNEGHHYGDSHRPSLKSTTNFEMHDDLVESLSRLNFNEAAVHSKPKTDYHDSSLRFKKLKLERHKAYRVLLSRVDSDTCYLLICNRKKFRQRTKAIIRRFRENYLFSPLSLFTRGTPCVGYCQETDSSERATILNVKGNFATLRFVDTGYTGSSRVSWLKELPEQLLDVPEDAVKCVVRNAGRHFYRALMENFTTDEELTCRAEDVRGDAHVVSLFYENVNLLEMETIGIYSDLSDLDSPPQFEREISQPDLLLITTDDTSNRMELVSSDSDSINLPEPLSERSCQSSLAPNEKTKCGETLNREDIDSPDSGLSNIDVEQQANLITFETFSYGRANAGPSIELHSPPLQLLNRQPHIASVGEPFSNSAATPVFDANLLESGFAVAQEYDTEELELISKLPKSSNRTGPFLNTRDPNTLTNLNSDFSNPFGQFVGSNTSDPKTIVNDDGQLLTSSKSELNNLIDQLTKGGDRNFLVKNIQGQPTLTSPQEFYSPSANLVNLVDQQQLSSNKIAFSPNKQGPTVLTSPQQLYYPNSDLVKSVDRKQESSSKMALSTNNQAPTFSTSPQQLYYPNSDLVKQVDRKQESSSNMALSTNNQAPTFSTSPRQELDRPSPDLIKHGDHNQASSNQFGHSLNNYMPTVVTSQQRQPCSPTPDLVKLVDYNQSSSSQFKFSPNNYVPTFFTSPNSDLLAVKLVDELFKSSNQSEQSPNKQVPPLITSPRQELYHPSSDLVKLLDHNHASSNQFGYSPNNHVPTVVTSPQLQPYSPGSDLVKYEDNKHGSSNQFQHSPNDYVPNVVTNRQRQPYSPNSDLHAVNPFDQLHKTPNESEHSSNKQVPTPFTFPRPELYSPNSDLVELNKTWNQMGRSSNNQSPTASTSPTANFGHLATSSNQTLKGPNDLSPASITVADIALCSPNADLTNFKFPLRKRSKPVLGPNCFAPASCLSPIREDHSSVPDFGNLNTYLQTDPKVTVVDSNVTTSPEEQLTNLNFNQATREPNKLSQATVTRPDMGILGLKNNLNDVHGHVRKSFNQVISVKTWKNKSSQHSGVGKSTSPEMVFALSPVPEGTNEEMVNNKTGGFKGVERPRPRLAIPSPQGFSAPNSSRPLTPAVFPGVKPHYRHLNLSKRDIFQVLVTHVSSFGEFYAQIMEGRSALSALMASMRSRYEDEFPTVANSDLKFVVSDACVCLLDDGFYYRGTVVEVIESLGILVKLVDYGLVKLVPSVDVRALDARFFSLPVQAVKFENLMTPDTLLDREKQMDAFKNGVNFKQLTLLVGERKGDNVYAAELLN